MVRARGDGGRRGHPATTFVEDWITGRTIVLDAIGQAVAAFALLAGLTLGALWLWYHKVRARLARR